MISTTAGISDLDQKFQHILRETTIIIIAVNVVVFAAIAVVNFAGGDLSAWLGLSSSIQSLIVRPWTIITYAFAQANLLQLIFNMLWLYGFGRLFLMRCDGRELFLLYIAGALSGAVFYLLAGIIFDHSSAWLLMGSSAAVIAIAVAVAVMMPDVKIDLPLLGQTKIKWIVGVVVVIFIIGLSTPNAGGNLAHIGGVAAGLAGARIIMRRNRSRSEHNSEYVKLTDKIRQSGFEALTSKERKRFFELSNQRK